MSIIKKYTILLLVFTIVGCQGGINETKVVKADYFIEEGVKKSDLHKDIEMLTDYGSIIIRLSDSTPKHRNNFIKLVNQQFYDSLSFHRVIQNFVIQTGDPESKNPDTDNILGETDLPYRIPAEFNDSLYHKRGALGAAREGDDVNPQRTSSSTQFYIVHGRVYNDSTLNIANGRINNWLAYNRVINAPENKIKAKKLTALMESESNTDSVAILKSDFDLQSEILLSQMETYDYPIAQREMYKTLGGVAHLDRNYTVFGEVVIGMDIVDSIASVKTDTSDKPMADVRIIKAMLIDRKNYN